MELCKYNKDHATWLLQQLRKEKKSDYLEQEETHNMR